MFAVRCLQQRSRGGNGGVKLERQKINQLMITFQLLVRLSDIEFWPSQRIRSLTLFSTEESKWHLTARARQCAAARSPAWRFSFFLFSGSVLSGFIHLCRVTWVEIILRCRLHLVRGRQNANIF